MVNLHRSRTGGATTPKTIYNIELDAPEEGRALRGPARPTLHGPAVRSSIATPYMRVFGPDHPPKRGPGGLVPGRPSREHGTMDTSRRLRQKYPGSVFSAGLPVPWRPESLTSRHRTSQKGAKKARLSPKPTCTHSLPPTMHHPPRKI